MFNAPRRIDLRLVRNEAFPKRSCLRLQRPGIGPCLLTLVLPGHASEAVAVPKICCETLHLYVVRFQSSNETGWTYVVASQGIIL